MARQGELRRLLDVRQARRGARPLPDARDQGRGRLRYSSWEDASTGARRSRLGVVVDDIDLMARGGHAAQDAAGAVAEAFPGAPVVQVADQDIPF